MRINYHKPTAEDKRNRANLWMAIGSFTSSILFTQVCLIGISLLILIILCIRFVIALAREVI